MKVSQTSEYDGLCSLFCVRSKAAGDGDNGELLLLLVVVVLVLVVDAALLLFSEPWKKFTLFESAFEEPPLPPTPLPEVNAEKKLDKTFPEEALLLLLLLVAVPFKLLLLLLPLFSSPSC